MKSSVSAPLLPGAYERNTGTNAFARSASANMFGASGTAQSKIGGTSIAGKPGSILSLIRGARQVPELKDEQLASLIHRHRPTLVLFYVPWCTVCIDMMLFWETLASKLAPVTTNVQDRSGKRDALIPTYNSAAMPALQGTTTRTHQRKRSKSIEQLETEQGHLCVAKMNASRSTREYGEESVPFIMLFAGGEVFSYDMDKLYATQDFQACAKKSTALITSVVDWIAASYETLDVKAMEARQRELQAIEDAKLAAISLKVILTGQEYLIPRASVPTVGDVKKAVLAKVGLDQLGRMLQLSAGQITFADADRVRVLPEVVYATVVALATFKKTDCDFEFERICTLSEDATAATCKGPTEGRWQVVEGNFKSEGTLGFAIRLDKLQGKGSVENVCIGVAPADFELHDEDEDLHTNAVAVCSGSSIRYNMDTEECNGGQNWREGHVIRVVFQGVSGKVMFFWDGDLKASYAPQLKRPVRAVVFMRHPGDQVTFVDARMNNLTT